ncbi:ArsR/SmtB family transcription factor [Nocardia crassostreae]|uniref:ArsR/SmtB family transcription factor n=1 Tax=Nocardia crassostreae TaxID=53428 RepID=UPI00083329F4|nr:metalloregulator ArsR/SmtB family transcription factor [Nocardia crassostreae]
MSNWEFPITDVTEPCAATPTVRRPVSAEVAAELSGIFKALSDPVRLRILTVVAGRAGQEACVCDLSEGFDVSQPTISHHLKVLREAGLLSSERRGSWVYYRIEPAALRQLSQLLDSVTPAEIAR